VPDEVRLHAASVAHVYEDRAGRNVLVVGGLAVAVLARPVLASIIAHELTHLRNGDTRVSRCVAPCLEVLGEVEYQWRRWRQLLLNPLAWPVRGYLWLTILAWYAAKREQEAHAIRAEVAQNGPESAAALLTLLAVFDCLPWARLDNVAEFAVKMNLPMTELFAEQLRRARAAAPAEWEEAFRKALRGSTGWFDSHPCLRDRLKMSRVSPKKALKLALDQQKGEPAAKLFNNWPQIEKLLTDRVVTIVRYNYCAKVAAAEIIRAVLR
jgi:Zn-dependent protease with chaperone function